MGCFCFFFLLLPGVPSGETGDRCRGLPYLDPSQGPSQVAESEAGGGACRHCQGRGSRPPVGGPFCGPPGGCGRALLKRTKSGATADSCPKWGDESERRTPKGKQVSVVSQRKQDRGAGRDKRVTGPEQDRVAMGPQEARVGLEWECWK